MTAAAELRLDDQLCFALYAASNSLVRAYRPLLAELGLTYPQYLLMMALWEHDDLPVHDLGRRTDLPANSVTPMLRRLVDAGFVTRSGDRHDGRVVRVRLTASGSRLEQGAAAVQAAVVARTGLSPDSLASIRGALHELTDATTRLRSADVTA